MVQVLGCDQPGEEAGKLKELVLWTLHFTTLLIEHSFSRHLYRSVICSSYFHIQNLKSRKILLNFLFSYYFFGEYQVSGQPNIWKMKLYTKKQPDIRPARNLVQPCQILTINYFSSMEHLSLLLSSFDLDVVLAVLNLLYMFSKRSNFISRLAPDKRQVLLNRYVAYRLSSK